MINLIIDLLMDGSLKAEYFDPSVKNNPRALAIIELPTGGDDILFDVIWSLSGGNYVAFDKNPIMLAIIDQLNGSLVGGQLMLSKDAVATLKALADAI